MTALVDTDVLVDILCGTPAAQAWLASVPTTAFAIPGSSPWSWQSAAAIR
jgi:predicted nucleic acid-binding protein